MNNKVLIAAIIASSTLLGGCAQQLELEKSVTMLTNQVNELSTKVDSLEAKDATLKMEVQNATDEAKRAHRRIDNIADSYTK